MSISLTRRIWLTVATIVLIFTVLVLYIVPTQQEKYFVQTFNHEVENLAKTVALGIEIALKHSDFKGINQAIEFAQSDKRLQFVAIFQSDTVWDENFENYEILTSLFRTYPPDLAIEIDAEKSDTVIIKRASYKSGIMNGEILVGFNIDEIKQNMNQIRFVAIIVSIVVFAFGILLGLWLARTISKPVKAIRDAAVKVGQGDLTQKVGAKSNDEIGQLSRAFNKMVDDLSDAENKIREKNQALHQTLEDLEEKNDLLGKEKKKSDKLLLNILPEKTAEELKRFGHSKPEYFKRVSVMFIDFASFTSISEKLTPEELVEELDFCFRKFDSIVASNGLEKIKTIGDAYMCVGGLPIINHTHALNCVKAGLEIQNFLKRHKASMNKENRPVFEARIGIHTGPVVAGIVGLNKFAYDIWGDTVNTASRMESTSDIGWVNISETTYEMVKDYPFVKFEARGKIQAKGKGEMEMYFVSKKE